MLLEINWLLTRWEKYQREEEAALGLRKRVRKVVSYREAYVAHPSEMANEQHIVYLETLLLNSLCNGKVVHGGMLSL